MCFSPPSVPSHSTALRYNSLDRLQALSSHFPAQSAEEEKATPAAGELLLPLGGGGRDPRVMGQKQTRKSTRACLETFRSVQQRKSKGRKAQVYSARRPLVIPSVSFPLLRLLPLFVGCAFFLPAARAFLVDEKRRGSEPPRGQPSRGGVARKRPALGRAVVDRAHEIPAAGGRRWPLFWLLGKPSLA